MKKIIATVFLFIFILVSSLATVSYAEDIDVLTATVTVYRQSASSTPVVLSGALVTLNNNTLSVQDLAGGGDIRYIVVITPDYQGDISGLKDTSKLTAYFVNTPTLFISTLAVTYSFSSGDVVNTPLNSTQNPIILNNEPNGSGQLYSITYSYSNTMAPFNRFEIEVNLSFDDPLMSALNGIQLRLDQTNLYLEDIVSGDQFNDDVTDFENFAGDVIDQITDYETITDFVYDQLVDVNGGLEIIDDYIGQASDMVNLLSDTQSSFALLTAPILNHPIVVIMSIFVSLCMLLCYLFYGRVG